MWADKHDVRVPLKRHPARASLSWDNGGQKDQGTDGDCDYELLRCS